jgi:hypothetical protein
VIGTYSRLYWCYMYKLAAGCIGDRDLQQAVLVIGTYSRCVGDRDLQQAVLVIAYSRLYWCYMYKLATGCIGDRDLQQAVLVLHIETCIRLYW